jgi:hypothetical protein
MANLQASKSASLRSNLLPGCRDAISDWDAFSWHRDQSNEVQAQAPRLSRKSDFRSSLRISQQWPTVQQLAC